MQGPRLRLVGRANEMAVLEDEFARAAAGEFRLVLLYGEAGVGKSRLGRELLAHHPEAAGTFARAHPLGVTAAFGLWAEAIGGWAAAAGGRRPPRSALPRSPAGSGRWPGSRPGG